MLSAILSKHKIWNKNKFQFWHVVNLKKKWLSSCSCNRAVSSSVVTCDLMDKEQEVGLLKDHTSFKVGLKYIVNMLLGLVSKDPNIE